MQAVQNQMMDSAAAAAVEAVLSAKDSEYSDLADTVARVVREEVRKGVREEVRKGMRKELHKELHGPSLINYKGYLGIYVVAEDGRRLKINEDRSIPMRRGGRYSLVLRIGAVADADADLTLPLQISGGVDAELVEFTVMLDGDDPGLRQPPQSVTVATAGDSASAGFPIEARWDNPIRLWLRVAQHGEFIQNVELTVPPLAGE